MFRLPIAPPLSTSSALDKKTRIFSEKLQAHFFRHSAERSLKYIKSVKAQKLRHDSEQRVLRLFHQAAKRVPAYRSFLKDNSVDSGRVRTIDDFRRVPWVNKKNYLMKYSLNELSWDGLLATSQMVAVSSGSSGVPCYWPRGSLLEAETSFMQEFYLRDVFEIHKHKTLYVNAFAMGMYIAGPIITNSALRVAQKGYPLTVITPGLEMTDIIRALKDLAPQFEQIILAGYPPFLKDVVDQGIAAGVPWDKFRVRFLLAGEGFNESWREYVGELVGAKDLLSTFINIYGTADASIVGHETPVSVFLRRLAVTRPEVFAGFFPEERGGRSPTFVQYFPTHKYFESIDNELLFSATAGIPLVRYNIHDLGGTIDFERALEIAGVRELELAQSLGGSPWRLPFVYLYGKSDFTVTLYGLNIYPENIKHCLEDRQVRDKLTGRFTMSTEYDQKTNDQFLLVNVELKRGVEPSRDFEKACQRRISELLRTVNVEYNKLYSSVGAERARPKIILHEHQSSSHFSRSIKHRWAA